MRYGCALVLTLISSAVPASAQDLPTVKTLGQTLGISMLPPETVVSPDQVVARLMMFDRNGDGKVATAELSERMQVIVARGDIGGDGALDDLEIRAMTLKPLEFVATATKNRQFGGYSFGDTVGLSTRTHILNTITDLRLASAANDEARRIASAFADELEAAARAKLQTAIAPLLTEQQLAEFDRNLNSNNGTVTPMFVARILLGQSQLTPQLVKTATAAVETFKTDQQLDDVRRSALVTQLRAVLTDEESDNFRAALARRPVVQTAVMVGGVVGGLSDRVEVLNQLRNAVPITTPRP